MCVRNVVSVFEIIGYSDAATSRASLGFHGGLPMTKNGDDVGW